MTTLTCDEVGDLAGAYALGLLDADERATIEDHLAGHWHEEYASARAAVLALASAAPEADPSPGLRGRVLDIARAEARREGRRWIPGMLAGAGLAAAVFAGLVFFGVLDRTPEPAQQMFVQNAGTGAYLDLTVEESGSRGSIRLGGLPVKPGDEVYQVWVIEPGRSPKSVSVIGADREGPWTRAVHVRLKPGDTLAVTVEPDGSRTAPSQSPILVGRYN